ncbi:MAG: hypothetical protein QOE86_1901 [Solirubrobacteraceae bacterium]|nr:hypothetical protein [Solirubrobacteraceae bacterium]
MPRFTPEGMSEATADEAVAAMLKDPATAKAARKAMAASDSGMFGQMAERLGQTAHASTVFAAPVERSGITVIPVARARYGFGGGTGEEGTGGGGGVMATPCGWIEITDSGSRYRPMRSRARRVVAAVLSLSVVGGVVAARQGVSIPRDLRRRGDAIVGRIVRRRASRMARLMRRS